MKGITDYKCYFFDFDGVILESSQIKTEAFGELYKEFGIERDVISYHLEHQGISRYEKFQWIAKNLLNTDITEAESLQLGEKFAFLVKQKILEASFVAGVEDLLKLLKLKNKKIVVASGTPQVELIEIVNERGLEVYFDKVYGSPQKKEDIVNAFIKKEDISSSDCLFIGDASTDYNAAVETRVDFFARITHEMKEYWTNKKTAFKKNNFKNLY